MVVETGNGIPLKDRRQIFQRVKAFCVLFINKSLFPRDNQTSDSWLICKMKVFGNQIGVMESREGSRITNGDHFHEDLQP